MQIAKEDIDEASKEWWNSRRSKYNLGLVITGISAFILYCILGIFLIAPHDLNFEITIFSILFQGIGFLIMILLANICYQFGFIIDKTFNKTNSEKYRERLFNFGYYFSISLPLLVPLMIVVEYFVRFA